MPGRGGSRARSSAGVGDAVRVPRQARADWEALTAVHGTGAADRSRLEALPEPARRWLDHAVPPGSPAARGVVIDTRGEIRLGRWRPFRARQVLVPGRGFVWAARVGRAPAAVTGFDRYAGGSGTMRWRLAAVVPVMSASGPDIDRSAAGRLAAEAVLVPPALLVPGIAWEEGDADHTVARIAEGGHLHAVTLTVGADGALRETSLPRWGSPDRGPARESLFRVRMEGEARHGGIALPGGYVAGWDEDPDGGFMRCEVIDARFR